MRTAGFLLVLLVLYSNINDVNAIRAFRTGSLRRDSNREESTTMASTDVDLMGSLKDLLSSHQEKEKHEQSRLDEVIATNNKLQEELLRKRAELANHAQLMSQLESCLAQTNLVAVGGGVTNTNTNTNSQAQAAAAAPVVISSSSPPSVGDASALPTNNNNSPPPPAMATIVTPSAPSTLPASIYPPTPSDSSAANTDSANSDSADADSNSNAQPSSLLQQQQQQQQQQQKKQPAAPPSHLAHAAAAAHVEPEMTMESLMKATPASLHAKMRELKEREAAIARAESDFHAKQTLLLQQQDELKQQLHTAQSLKLTTSSPSSPSSPHHTFTPSVVSASAFLQEQYQPSVIQAPLSQASLPAGLRLPSFPLHSAQQLHAQAHAKAALTPNARDYITPSYVMAETKATSHHTPSASPASPAAFLDIAETTHKHTTSTSSSSLSVSALTGPCASYTTCATCAADPNCAWCFDAPHSAATVNDTLALHAAGVCMSHNVNFIQREAGPLGASDSDDLYHNMAFHQRKRASVMGGVGDVTQLADGLILGQCAAGDWSSSLANEQPTFLSFNVFADDVPASWSGGTPPRVTKIIELITAMTPQPHVIAFQEAEGWFVECLRKNTALMAAYPFQTNYGEMIAPGGLFILARVPLKDINYIEKVAPGQNRIDERARLLVASMDFNGREVWVANTCLDWRSPAARVESLRFIFSTLTPFRDVVLLGDFNFDEGAPEESAIIPYCDGWVDTWTKLKPGQDGHTWDPTTNAYAKKADPQSLASRIDRIFLKSTNLLPMTIAMVGSYETSTHSGLLLQTNLFLSTCPTS